MVWVPCFSAYPPHAGHTMQAGRQEAGGGEMVQQEHGLHLVERKSLRVTGVTEVMRFEDTAVVLQTEMGLLTVLGEELQLKELSVEGGSVTIEGNVSALSYQEPKTGGWLRRVLG